MSDINNTPDSTPTVAITAKEAKAEAKAAKARAKALRPWYKKPSRIIPLALVILIGISVATGGGETTSDTATAVVSETTEETTTEEVVVEEEADATAGIGDKVRDGKFEFVVTDVERGLSTYGEGFLAEEAQGKFTVIKVTVENIGDEAQTFFASNATGIDSKGRELDAESILDDSMLEDINPGNSIKATVVFDVAKGETLDAVVLHDSLFSGGVVVALS